MKKLFALVMMLSAVSVATHAQLLKKLGDKVKDKTEQKVDQKVDQAIDKGLDKTEEGTKNATKNDKENKDNSNTKSAKDTVVTPEKTNSSLKVYSNYDFVPGDKILFEDQFTDDQDGEFATHWELKAGQAVFFSR